MNRSTRKIVGVTQKSTLLRGVRIVSLALNLPGPAALLRLQALGARCLKVEPPAGDPMRHYSEAAYRALNDGLRTLTLDLKTEAGQARLKRELAKCDVLVTSFRPSALRKLGLHSAALRREFPALSCVEIVGAPGPLAEHPGHDLTYQAEAGLVNGMALPPSLLADMAGALLTTEAVLEAVLAQRSTGRGVQRQVALSDAVEWLALPRVWGLTCESEILGGAHAGYRVYACQDGRVALAALEPHFASRCSAVMGLGEQPMSAWLQTEQVARVAAYMARQTRAGLDALAREHDLPLVTMPA